jgi:hypothetical protein
MITDDSYKIINSEIKKMKKYLPFAVQTKVAVAKLLFSKLSSPNN